jgi:sulfoxide reductase heme-binding subunit YedZ
MAEARIPWPWLDARRRVSPLRIAVLVALLAPGALLLLALGTGGLGAEPWKAATREAGDIALKVLLASLAVTPLRILLDRPKIGTLRRMVGLGALGYALLHLLLYSGHLGWNMAQVAGEIALRLYLTLGFAVLVGLCVLGWTSTDGWQRRLGPGWKRLHRWVYLLAAGGVFHAFLQSRGVADSAVLMAAFLLWLLAWRTLPGRWRAQPLALAGLAAAVGLGTAAVEFGWYSAATNLPAGRILLANLDLVAGPRPAVAVVLAALLAAGLPLLRRRPGRPARA